MKLENMLYNIRRVVDTAKNKAVAYSLATAMVLPGCSGSAYSVGSAPDPVELKSYTYENDKLPKTILNQYELAKRDHLDTYEGSLTDFLEGIDKADGRDDNHISKSGMTRFKTNLASKDL